MRERLSCLACRAGDEAPAGPLFIGGRHSSAYRLVKRRVFTPWTDTMIIAKILPRQAFLHYKTKSAAERHAPLEIDASGVDAEIYGIDLDAPRLCVPVGTGIDRVYLLRRGETAAVSALHKIEHG